MLTKQERDYNERAIAQLESELETLRERHLNLSKQSRLIPIDQADQWRDAYQKSNAVASEISEVSDKLLNLVYKQLSY